jgi:hypothetical protein
MDHYPRRDLRQALCVCHVHLRLNQVPHRGHAIALAVSCWLLTVLTWVHSQGSPCGILVGNVAVGQAFLQAHY